MEKKITHLNEVEREEIRAGLREGLSFVEIAFGLGRDPSTIRKEVKRNRFKKEKVTPKFGIEETCLHHATCRKRHICEERKGRRKCKIPCRKCLHCKKYCKDYQEDICNIATKAPLVCNGCKKQRKCSKEKYYYGSMSAQANYEKRLSDSREGVRISQDEMNALDELVAPLIKKGQPISHIYAAHGDEIMVSRRTLYHYINEGYLSVINLDLRRKVRYSKRKLKHSEVKVDKGLKEGRKYQDFLRFAGKHMDQEVVEMDTVEGVKGGKLLLTMKFLKSKLLIIRLLEDKRQETVLEEINAIEKALGYEDFAKTFFMTLVDNGTEFADPRRFEASVLKEGSKRTNFFYCDPGKAWQKGRLEKEHEYIRYVLPKGKSFDSLTPEKVKLLMNHINNTSRDGLGTLTPLQLAWYEGYIEKEVIKKLGITQIPPDEVTLTQDLVK